MKNDYITATREPCLCSECAYFRPIDNSLVGFSGCRKGHFSFADKEKCEEFKYWKEEL